MKLQFLLMLLTVQFLQASIFLPTVEPVFNDDLLKQITFDAHQYTELLELQKKSKDSQPKIWWYLGGFIVSRLQKFANATAADVQIEQFLNQKKSSLTDKMVQELFFLYKGMEAKKRIRYLQALKKRYAISDLSTEEQQALCVRLNRYETYKDAFLKLQKSNKEYVHQFNVAREEEVEDSDKRYFDSNDADEFACSHWVQTGNHVNTSRSLLSVVAKQKKINETELKAYQQLFENISKSKFLLYSDLKAIFTEKNEMDRIVLWENYESSYFNILSDEHLKRLALMNKMPC